MKKLWKAFIITVLLLSTFQFGTNQLYAADGEEFAWVLTEIIDYDLKEEIAEYNKSKVYQIEGKYARSNFAITRRYIGKTDTYPDPDKINGEEVTIQANWSEPPKMMNSKDEVSLTLQLSATNNTQSFYSFDGIARALLGKSDFDNKDGKHSFVIGDKNNYQSYNETVTAVVPTGREEGDELKLIVQLYNNLTMKTVYLYKWKKQGSSSEIDTSSPSSESTTPADTETSSHQKNDRREDIRVPKTPDGKYIDSGCRVSEIAGEVLIRHGDDRLGWDLLQPDMVIYEGDVIRTNHDSRVQIALYDMTQFTMKPNSEIIMNTSSEKENKIMLLVGKIIANVKQIAEDGSMDIGMSQAVAGIKGTTFVLEDDGATSTLKVLEGTVAFTPYGKEPITVTNEEAVSVTNGVASEIKRFSLEDELSTWDIKTQDQIKSVLSEKGIDIEETVGMSTTSAEEDESSYMMIMIVIVVILIILLAILLFLLKRKDN